MIPGKGWRFAHPEGSSFIQVWTEGEFTSDLGELQSFPWETESGDVLLCRFGCRRCLLSGEDPEELICYSCLVGFLPHYGARECSEGSKAAPWGLGLTRECEWGLSRSARRCAVNVRKQTHADLQWSSRVLHRIAAATPAAGTSPGAPLLLLHCR